jgi:hypothetical protein
MRPNLESAWFLQPLIAYKVGKNRRFRAKVCAFSHSQLVPLRAGMYYMQPPPGAQGGWAAQMPQDPNQYRPQQ